MIYKRRTALEGRRDLRIGYAKTLGTQLRENGSLFLQKWLRPCCDVLGSEAGKPHHL